METSEFLAEFEAEKAKIEADKRLSNQGKAEKISKLKSEYVSKAKELKKSLRKIAVMSALHLRDAQAKQRDHLEKEQTELDYERLNYHAQAVKAKIARAKSLPEVYELWDQAKRSGDLYTIKAWQDTVSLDRFDGDDPGRFKEQIFDDLASVDVRERDPEILEIEREHLRTLSGLEDHAKALDAFLDGGKAISRGRIARKVFEGIEFDREGQVQTEFDYGDHILFDRQEKASEVADRLERDRLDDAEKYLEVGKRFGVELDPDLDL